MKYFSDTIEAETWDDAKAALRPRLGENLRNLRQMRGLTPEEVAEGVGGITANTLRNYEKGETGIGLESAWMLADFYGVTLAAIVGRIAYEPAPTAAGDAA